MIEPTRHPFGVFTFTPEIYESWSRGSGVILRCDFCGHIFQKMDKARCTYSNSDGHACGNPLTCSSCLEIPYEKRLEIWDFLELKSKMAELFKLVRNVV